MKKDMKWAMNHLPKSDDKNLPIMSLSEVAKARTFHQSFPQYSETPLTRLTQMARYLGVGSVFIKDESYRFGLNAFKVLGGSYSMAKYIAKETHRDVSDMPYDVLTSDELRQEFGQATFFTATDGNHGRGVAWAAQKLGQKAVVHMPKGTTQTRLENIKKLGADVDILDLNYDDCVRQAAKEATATPHGVMVQDTAWDGYEEIPSWIMQGYGTMAMEAGEQLKAQGIERPTHIFVQAGVGSLVPSSVISPTSIKTIRRNSSSSKHRPQPASTKAPQPVTASPAWSAATWIPSWPAWPVANRTPFPGTSSRTM